MTIARDHENTQRSAVEGSRREPGTESDRLGHYLMAVIRLSLGWVFLWAFLDKTFGLGHETMNADAWINGGNPTEGFLSFAAAGPFEDFYHDIAGEPWADWLFMIGLLGIGVALVLGITMRIAAVSGAVLLVMMWTVVLPPDNNPFMDDHLVYALVLLALAALSAGRTWGMGALWERIPFVAHNRWLI